MQIRRLNKMLGMKIIRLNIPKGNSAKTLLAAERSIFGQNLQIISVNYADHMVKQCSS